MGEAQVEDEPNSFGGRREGGRKEEGDQLGEPSQRHQTFLWLLCDAHQHSPEWGPKKGLLGWKVPSLPTNEYLSFNKNDCGYLPNWGRWSLTVQNSFTFLGRLHLSRVMSPKSGPCFRTAVPNLFATRDQFGGRQFFHGLGWRRWRGWFRDETVLPEIIRH